MTDPVDAATGEIDYDSALFLDAEDLAEGGVAAAYEEVGSELRRRGVAPERLTEALDHEAGTYAVEFRGSFYPICGPTIPGSHSWGLAAFALFDIVNRQLTGHDVRFYAINGGNDLMGIFMTPAQAQSARTALNRKSDWPYVPSAEPGWFGMHHD